MIRKAQRTVRVALSIAILLTPATARAAALITGKVTSHWSGTTKAGCGALLSDKSRCNALQNITLIFVQEGSKIRGSYTCSYGNQNCRGMQAVGKIIDGSLNGEQLQFVVLMPDGVTCRYTGLLGQDSGKGAYRCNGGRSGEQGTWRIHPFHEGSAAPTPQVRPLFRP
jgi:hypothetical protein